MSNLTGYPGERIVRRKLGFDKIPSLAETFNWISREMAERHSESTFNTERIPFLSVCIFYDEGFYPCWKGWQV